MLAAGHQPRAAPRRLRASAYGGPDGWAALRRASEAPPPAERAPRAERAERAGAQWGSRGARRAASGDDGSDDEEGEEEGSPRERAAAARRSLSWDARGAFRVAGRGAGAPAREGAAGRLQRERAAAPDPRAHSGAQRRLLERAAAAAPRAAAQRTAKPWRAKPAVAAAAAAAAARQPPPLPLPPALPRHADPFVRLGLSEAAGLALAAAGLRAPTPIQSLALPSLLRGASAAVLAETGSGKTLTYALPLLTRLYASWAGGARRARTPATACPQILLLLPSRELGVQAAAAAAAAADCVRPNDAPRAACVLPLLGRDKRAMAAVLASGGRAAPPATAEDEDSLSPGAFEAADLVVATPRAALTALTAGRLRLGRLDALVLDEADELLSPGFAADVKQLLRKAVPDAENARGVFGQPVQVVFAAATMGRAEWDGRLRAAWPGKLARIASPGLHRGPAALRQRVRAVAGEAERAAALLEALADWQEEGAESAPGLPALVFASSPAEADEVAALLVTAGLPAAAFHGRTRGARGELLDELQAGHLAALVVTDIAARGLDLPCVRNVVQWRPAPSAALHLHRVGRTGRAGAPGACQATALFDPGCEADRGMGAFALLAAAAAAGGSFGEGELIDTGRLE